MTTWGAALLAFLPVVLRLVLKFLGSDSDAKAKMIKDINDYNAKLDAAFDKVTHEKDPQDLSKLINDKLS